MIKTLDDKNGRGARVALAEGVNLPNTRGESGNVPGHLQLRQPLVGEGALLLEIIFEGFGDDVPRRVAYRIALQNPFVLCDVVSAIGAGLLQKALEQPPMN